MHAHTHINTHKLCKVLISIPCFPIYLLISIFLPPFLSHAPSTSLSSSFLPLSLSLSPFTPTSLSLSLSIFNPSTTLLLEQKVLSHIFNAKNVDRSKKTGIKKSFSVSAYGHQAKPTGPSNDSGCLVSRGEAIRLHVHSGHYMRWLSELLITRRSAAVMAAGPVSQRLSGISLLPRGGLRRNGPAFLAQPWRMNH